MAPAAWLACSQSRVGESRARRPDSPEPQSLNLSTAMNAS